MSHGLDPHSHAAAKDGNARRLQLAFGVTAGFMVIEAIGGVISGFKDWKKSTQDRSAKNKQRLEQALTPGGGSKVTTAHSAEDEFVAGFYSARGR